MVDMEEGKALDYLTLDNIAGAGFRASLETDSRAGHVKDILGFGSHNIPARLAIARSLAIAEPPPKTSGELGRNIKGDSLFGSGADLAAWVSLLIAKFGSAPPTLKDFQAFVSAHWTRGMLILSDDLRATGDDSGEFWRRLAESALPRGGRVAARREGPVTEAQFGAIVVRLGEVGTDVATGEDVLWDINAPGGSPHSAFMGGVGSGKTRTAAYVLRSIAEQCNVPLIAFDFKGDMSDRNNGLDKAFGAAVVTPPRQAVPLDVFALSGTGPHALVSTAQRLRDSLGNLKQTKFGDQQRRRLYDALETALKQYHPCTLEDVRNTLVDLYAELGIKEDGAVSALVDLCRLPLFEAKMSPEEFFSRSWIISLPADVPDVVRVAVVSLLTDALERYINALPDAPTDEQGNRSMRVMCVIDEAHRILGAKLPGLLNLIRLGRSKGAAVMLISQKPDDFEGEDDDFLSEMGLVTCFGTNAKETAVKRILGAGASLTSLKKGEAYVKQRGDARAKKVICWK